MGLARPLPHFIVQVIESFSQTPPSHEEKCFFIVRRHTQAGHETRLQLHYASIFICYRVQLHALHELDIRRIDVGRIDGESKT